MRRSTVTLAAILAIGAVLRFWGLGAGIPYSIGVDEPEIMDRAVTMMKTGDFNPYFFDYPGLYIYVQLLACTVQFLAGATTGTYRSLADIAPTDFYFWGRAVTATLGTATILLVYLAAMRWGTRYALFAATLMAVVPLHVRESHYILTDVPVTFFIALAFVLTLRAAEQPHALAFAWAGAAVGLAAATKYTGGLSIVLPMLAVWMSPAAKPSRATAALVVVAAAALAFLMAAPYTVLDLPAFLDGYAKLAGSYNRSIEQDGLAIAFKHLRGGLHWPATLAVLGGVVFALVRAIKGPGRVRWAVTVVFPLLYFWFVSKQSLIFGRYLLPLVPFACVLAAAAVVSGVSLLRRYEIPRKPRTALIAALTILALLPPAITAVGFNRTLTQTATVAQAYDWIHSNVPPGSKIVLESRALLPGRKYDFTTVVQLRQQDYDYYRAQKVDYIVASSQCYGQYFASPQKHPEEYADYMRIFEQSRELVRFRPGPENPGPELRIFKVVP